MLELLKKLIKNKEGKTLLSNFGYLSLLQIAGYVFPLITVPYLARTIGVDGYGKIAFAAAIVGWMMTITDWGFKFTATRDLAQNRDNKEKVSEILSNTFWAQCALMILAFFFLASLVFTIPKFRENMGIIFITFLVVPGRVMFPEWFFQAVEKMKYITILNVISRLIFTVAVFVFIKQKDDFIIQPLLTAIGYILVGIISMYVIIGKWRVKLIKPSLPKIISTIKGGSDIFINTLMPNLYNSFSTVLLGIWGGPVQNGLLSAATKFINMGIELLSVISRTFFPFLSRRIEKHDLFLKMYLSVGLLGTISFILLAPFLIHFLYTPEFYESIPALRIMAVSIFAISLISAYGSNYLILEKYEKELRNITAFCSIAGLLISVPLIYYFHFMGAAVAITTARVILGVFIMLKATKVKKQLKHQNQ